MRCDLVRAPTDSAGSDRSSLPWLFSAAQANDVLRLTAAAGALGLVALVDDAMQQLALEVVGSRYPWLRERSTAARLTAVEATVHALGVTSPLPPPRALRRGFAMCFPKRPNLLHSIAALPSRARGSHCAAIAFASSGSCSRSAQTPVDADATCDANCQGPCRRRDCRAV